MHVPLVYVQYQNASARRILISILEPFLSSLLFVLKEYLCKCEIFSMWGSSNGIWHQRPDLNPGGIISFPLSILSKSTGRYGKLSRFVPWSLSNRFYSLLRSLSALSVFLQRR